MTTTYARAIEPVPAAVVCALSAEGRLPRLPPRLEAGFARPTSLDETAALWWAIEWQGAPFERGSFGRPLGVLGYRDVFDYARSMDVREIVHLAGTKRACFNLLRWIHARAHNDGLPLVGHVSTENVEMTLVLRKLGARTTHVHFEAT